MDNKIDTLQNDKNIEKVLNLAKTIKLVQENKNLTKKAKKKELTKIVKENKKAFLKLVFIFLQTNLWTKRSWTIRLALIGLLPGLALGGKSVGVATMGLGIGIPIFLLTSTGSAFIGLVIDNIKLKQELKKNL